VNFFCSTAHELISHNKHKGRLNSTGADVMVLHVVNGIGNKLVTMHGNRPIFSYVILR